MGAVRGGNGDLKKKGERLRWDGRVEERGKDTLGGQLVLGVRACDGWGLAAPGHWGGE